MSNELIKDLGYAVLVKYQIGTLCYFKAMDGQLYLSSSPLPVEPYDSTSGFGMLGRIKDKIVDIEELKEKLPVVTVDDLNKLLKLGHNVLGLMKLEEVDIDSLYTYNDSVFEYAMGYDFSNFIPLTIGTEEEVVDRYIHYFSKDDTTEHIHMSMNVLNREFSKESKEKLLKTNVDFVTFITNLEKEDIDLIIDIVKSSCVPEYSPIWGPFVNSELRKRLDEEGIINKHSQYNKIPALEYITDRDELFKLIENRPDYINDIVLYKRLAVMLEFDDLMKLQIKLGSRLPVSPYSKDELTREQRFELSVVCPENLRYVPSLTPDESISIATRHFSSENQGVLLADHITLPEGISDAVFDAFLEVIEGNILLQNTSYSIANQEQKIKFLTKFPLLLGKVRPITNGLIEWVYYNVSPLCVETLPFTNKLIKELVEKNRNGGITLVKEIKKDDFDINEIW